MVVDCSTQAELRPAPRFLAPFVSVAKNFFTVLPSICWLAPQPDTNPSCVYTCAPVDSRMSVSGFSFRG